MDFEVTVPDPATMVTAAEDCGEARKDWRMRAAAIVGDQAAIDAQNAISAGKYRLAPGEAANVPAANLVPDDDEDDYYEYYYYYYDGHQFNAETEAEHKAEHNGKHEHKGKHMGKHEHKAKHMGKHMGKEIGRASCRERV